MNLGKLLSAGKSIFSGGGTVRYREDKRYHLPKFNADRNPFAPCAGENAPGEVAPEPAKTQKLPEISTKTQKIPVAPAARPARALSWKDKLNPFRPAEPPVPSMVGAVQAELSLDAVKVVRNDLADADIEVVPVKSQTVSAPETPVLPPARQSWEFLGERLVKAD